MRFMIMGKATKESEAGFLPPPEAFAAMGEHNEELVKAGILLTCATQYARRSRIICYATPPTVLLT
jgi:hypothetical protein